MRAYSRLTSEELLMLAGLFGDDALELLAMNTPETDERAAFAAKTAAHYGNRWLTKNCLI